MHSVEVYIQARSTELTKDVCLELYYDISSELDKKFSELQSAGDADIRKKCYDLDNYINTIKEEYKRCEKHVPKDDINIDNYIKELSTTHDKYTKCSSASTSNGKEGDISKPETKELCTDPVGCAKEQVPPQEKILESSCKKDSSESGCLHQEEILKQNVELSALSDNTTTEQKTTVASTASTLDDPLVPNCPLCNSSDIRVIPSPSCPSQAKPNPSSDVISNNLSLYVPNNEQYIIMVMNLPMAAIVMKL
ncbi:hypothetical protein PCYB_004790 [Plasmodium cynomolgi strain B]|uniref:CYIR protein n=1 Tax=Plasmodium cynomolgi (strain B) TaxID=1120755 RepID=K6V324_PLACD|nr:hypothetical protein PCYB_004790 [Plasmodium cynomolgi strain B]GAB69730.1 hypothetical protein PCYB_004790 [Plasmodium cynomolgi strain B]